MFRFHMTERGGDQNVEDAIVRVEASRSPEFDSSESILGIRAIILCKRALIGDGSDCLIGLPNQQASLMFPAGTGIILSAGEPIYLNLYASNNWKYPYSEYAYCILYEVGWI